MTETPTILIADDDQAIRVVLERALRRHGYKVRLTDNARTLWKWVARGEGDLIVTDVVMPDDNGLDLIPRIRNIRPALKVIVMSAQNTILTAVKANERGAYDYLPKPFDLSDLLQIVERGLEDGDLGLSNEILDTKEELPLIGRSVAMQQIYRTVARLITTDLTVMITGESGTGKELVARALHDYGRRSERPFVAINMAAIPRDLIESELFGHERGAFTGATSRGVGRFEQAQGGTLFLDEIGDMPIEAQTRLLRVLQDGEYTSVGGREEKRSDVRIIAATHRELGTLIGKGQFREDLYYRLNVVPMRLPPLRERTEDIPELFEHFVLEGVEEGLPMKTMHPDGMPLLIKHDWPGNVRELKNLVQRLAALYAEETITPDILMQELADNALKSNKGSLEEETMEEAIKRHIGRLFLPSDNGLPDNGLYSRVLRKIERPLISLTLKAARGNQLRAAEILGLNRNTLRKKIRELEIDVIKGQS